MKRAGEGVANLTGQRESKYLKNKTYGVPEGIRTPDLRFRKPLLYPAELPGLKAFRSISP